MVIRWFDPGRIAAHRLLHPGTTLAPLQASNAVRASMGARLVEDVFHRGLIPDVVNAPDNTINTRLDDAIDQLIGFKQDADDELARWSKFARGANLRRRRAEPFLGLSLPDARSLLVSDVGRYLIHSLPFEDLAKRNDTHELLYFRDSGIHRRMIERSTILSPFTSGKANRQGVSLEDARLLRLAHYEPKRWEAFVVVSILDLVGDRCTAFAYRDEETAEIDLILEWRDALPCERWAIEVASRKFNGHPSDHFPHSCERLGVNATNRFVVFKANGCSGTERGRGGVRARALPRMLDLLRQRLREP